VGAPSLPFLLSKGQGRCPDGREREKEDGENGKESQ